MTNKTTNLTFRVSSELKQKFVEEAKANGTTATALFHQWMEDYINGKKPSTDNVSADSTYSTDDAQTTSTDSTNDALTDKLESLESRVRELSEENKYQSQQHETLTNYLNELRDRVETLENSTAHTDSTNNNETPASEEKDGGSVTQQRDGEATIPQPQNKFRQPSTNSTDNAHTKETDHSESPTTEETEGSAIAQTENPEKKLAKDKRLLDAISEYIPKGKPKSKLKPFADIFVQLLKEYGIEDEGFHFTKTKESECIKSCLGLGKQRPKETSKFYRAANILWEAHENAKDRNEL